MIAWLSWTLRLFVTTGTFVHWIFIVNISKFWLETDCFCICDSFLLYILQHYNDNFQLQNAIVFSDLVISVLWLCLYVQLTDERTYQSFLLDKNDYLQSLIYPFIHPNFVPKYGTVQLMICSTRRVYETDA